MSKLSHRIRAQRPSMPRRRLPLATWLGSLLLVALVSACQAQVPPAKAGADAEAALLARIRAEIGQAACASDNQCRTLGVGERACGGPAGWLAWSGDAARGQRLDGWAAELAALQRKRYQDSGMMSTCQVLPDPGARCVAKRCQLQGGGAVAPAR